MIIINPQLECKKNIIANHKTFPHLYIWNDELKEYENISKFWWDFDEDYNLVIETMLDGEQLIAEILRVLNKQREFVKIIIKTEQKKLASINKMLKGEI